MADDSAYSIGNPFDQLGEGERSIIKNAEDFLRISIPDPSMTSQASMYVTSNLTQQQQVNTFKTNVLHTLYRRRQQLMKIEAEERDMLVSDGFKYGAERDTLVMRNSRIADLRRVVDWLDTIHRHLESLEWMLKSALRSLTG